MKIYNAHSYIVKCCCITMLTLALLFSFGCDMSTNKIILPTEIQLEPESISVIQPDAFSTKAPQNNSVQTPQPTPTLTQPIQSTTVHQSAPVRPTETGFVPLLWPGVEFVAKHVRKPIAVPIVMPNYSPIPRVDVSHIDPSKPMIAFTFDDGPTSPHTSRILDVLETYSARATFFVVGYQVERQPQILKRAYALGCEIGNHTYNHKNLSKISVEEIKHEVESLNALLKKTIGVEPTLVRCPYGAGIRDKKVLASVPYPLIMWTIDTLDWSTRSALSTIEAIRKDIRDGSIILLHDMYSSTVEAFEQIVPELIAQGYQLVTVSELFSAKGYELSPGKYYRRAY